MARKNWSDKELLIVIELYLRPGMGYTEKYQLGAKLTGRTEGSIKKRFGNIEYLEKGTGGYPNTGKRLKELWSEYGGDYGKIEKKVKQLYKEGSVGMSSNTELEEIKRLMEEGGSYREVTTKQRKQQDKLRRLVLKLSNRKCCATGICIDSMLVASHIKPWSECTSKEKVDPHNALCLNAFHDKLFDNYLMTVNENMEIIYNPLLKDAIPEAVYKTMIESCKKIEVNDNNRPDKKYLDYHNKRFKEKLPR